MEHEKALVPEVGECLWQIGARKLGRGPFAALRGPDLQVVPERGAVFTPLAEPTLMGDIGDQTREDALIKPS